MKSKKIYLISEACEKLGIQKQYIIHCIRQRWILPAEPANAAFDDEDLARAQLILELQNDFGANDESIPIILHLLDELYVLRSRVREAA